MNMELVWHHDAGAAESRVGDQMRHIVDAGRFANVVGVGQTIVFEAGIVDDG